MPDCAAVQKGKVMIEQQDKRVRLSKVSVSGFKSFGTSQNSLDIDLCDINIIIGANGSGKSNFLSFFTMLSYMMTNQFQLYVAKQGFANRILHFGARKTQHIDAEIHFQSSEHSNIYKSRLDYATDDKLVIGDEILNFDGKEKRLSSGERESYFAAGHDFHQNEKIVRRLLSGCRTFQFHDTSDKSRIRLSADLKFNRHLYSDGGNLPVMLYVLQQKYPQYFYRIETYVGRIIPSFSHFVLEPDRLADGQIF